MVRKTVCSSIDEGIHAWLLCAFVSYLTFLSLFFSPKERQPQAAFHFNESTIYY